MAETEGHRLVDERTPAHVEALEVRTSVGTLVLARWHHIFLDERQGEWQPPGRVHRAREYVRKGVPRLLAGEEGDCDRLGLGCPRHGEERTGRHDGNHQRVAAVGVARASVGELYEKLLLVEEERAPVAAFEGRGSDEVAVS